MWSVTKRYEFDHMMWSISEKYANQCTPVDLAVCIFTKIMTTIWSALIHPECWSNIHNVNDRGYHKMWSPASSTRTMTNTSYYIQYSIETAMITSYHKMWSAMKEKCYVWSQYVSNVIRLQIDGHDTNTNWMSCPSSTLW